MRRSPSAKPLFKAIKAKADDGSQMDLMPDLPEQGPPERPQDQRDPLDYDPTPPDATRAFLAAEGERLRQIGQPIWESAVGGGHMARVLLEAGFDVIPSDVVDRGWPGTTFCNFLKVTDPPSTVTVTNPPYNLINSHAAGKWLEHSMDIGIRYAAFLLSWNWPQPASLNGLLDRYPPSRAYLCDWKIDFRGLGNPPNCSGWFVWDRDGPGSVQWRTMKLTREDKRQGEML